ncbi:MAG: tetratricopeptide repeat protein [Crocinitomicaceae bacterium]|nr:tetratricopeptide repeat protein [Crocinitomicaceae bacterium]
MKKCILFLTLSLLSFIGITQEKSISEDSLVNRLKLNDLNLRIESGRADANDYYNRGVLNTFFGDENAALEDYSIAIKKKPDFDLPYLNRGSIYQRQEKFELSLKDFNDAMKLDKFPSIALNNRGYLYQSWGKLDKAIKDFESAVKIDPGYTQPYMNLVDIYLSQNKKEAAFEVLDRMIKARPKDPKALTSRSDVYRNVGRFQEALDDLNEAVEVSGNDPGFIIERAKFKDDYIFEDFGAVEDCDLAIQKNPNVADYYYQRARPLYDLGDYTAVLEDCDKALALDPKHVNALIMKANVTDMYKFHDDAKILYEQAIAITPDDYDAYKQLSVSEFAQGKKKKALSTLENYMNRGNFHKDITEQHGKIAADLKQFDVSVKDFSELVSKYPENPAYYFLRGITKDSLGNHEEACDDMVTADKLGLREAHQYLRDHCKSRLSAKLIQVEDMLDEALQFEQYGKNEEAILVYSDLIKIAPDSSVFYYNRGKVKRRLEDHEGAIEDYLKAIEINDDRVVYIVSLAVSYSYLDRNDDAIKEYRRAIKIEPRYAMSYYNLGGIYAQDKKYDKAIELFETSLVYSPKYTRAMMGLGDCYLEMNELDKACEWFKRAEDAGETKAFGKRVRTCR